MLGLLDAFASFSNISVLISSQHGTYNVDKELGGETSAIITGQMLLGINISYYSNKLVDDRGIVTGSAIVLAHELSHAMDFYSIMLKLPNLILPYNDNSTRAMQLASGVLFNGDESRLYRESRAFNFENLIRPQISPLYGPRSVYNGYDLSSYINLLIGWTPPTP